MGDKIVDFKCPADCLPGVGEVFSGQYAFPAAVNGPCLVLDIGANCGAFALWARRVWPQSRVFCYEPHPEIFRVYLKPNIAHDAKISALQVGVGDPLFRILRPGTDTRLCSSFYDIGRQGNASMKVDIVEPGRLPVANIVKIDTEGSEGYIVEHMEFTPDLLVVEYHSEDLRGRVEAALRGRMTLLECHVNGLGWGHLKYAKRGEK